MGDALKMCKDCGADKPRAEFNQRSARCKPCQYEYVRTWRADNPDKVAAAQRKYRTSHAAERYATVKRWRADNPEKRRANDLRRRAREATGSFSDADMHAMYRDQDGLCAYCEAELNGEYHVEHMTPLSRGGLHDWSNIALTCAACNLSKGTKTVEEFVCSK